MPNLGLAAAIRIVGGAGLLECEGLIPVVLITVVHGTEQILAVANPSWPCVRRCCRQKNAERQRGAPLRAGLCRFEHAARETTSDPQCHRPLSNARMWSWIIAGPRGRRSRCLPMGRPLSRGLVRQPGLAMLSCGILED